MWVLLYNVVIKIPTHHAWLKVTKVAIDSHYNNIVANQSIS